MLIYETHCFLEADLVKARCESDLFPRSSREGLPARAGEVALEAGRREPRGGSCMLRGIETVDKAQLRFTGRTDRRCALRAQVDPMPQIIPAMAPSRLNRFEKIPMTMTGKNDEAASPKAKATTAAT